MNIFSRRNIVIAGAAVLVLVIAAVVSFDPVTRNFVARQELCTYCHVANEYVGLVLLSDSLEHPPRSESEGGSDEKARCVDCHVPPGFFYSVLAYTHFLSITDLYGHFRDRAAGRLHRSVITRLNRRRCNRQGR